MSLLDKIEHMLKKGDKKNRLDFLDLTNQDIVDELQKSPLLRGRIDGKTYILGKFTEEEIYELMAWSGIFEKIEKRGYKDFRLELEYLSDLDQRIFIKWGKEVLFHLRLKTSTFRFRFSPGAPSRKLLYIDWLSTRDPLRKQTSRTSLFPGQDCPGLGIFHEIADFIFNLAIGLHVKGVFNVPEYFHDAVLFHRHFRFYDPQREAFFRALLRDLRHYGAKRITEALSSNKVRDQDNQVVGWIPGEMIALIDPELSDFVWNKEYFAKVISYLKRYRFRILD